MFGRFVGLVAVGALCVSSQAFAANSAASLSAISGAVSVSHAGKVSAATAGALQTGDRVIAANGQATVAYADGCVVQLKANTMATVGAQSPCATGAGVVTAADGSAAQFGAMTTTQAVGTALAVGAFVYGAVSVLDDDDDAVSP